MAQENGNRTYKTFAGGGFGTLLLRRVAGPRGTPPVASSRAYMRNELPALYHEGDFGMRLVAALETVVDPIAAVLDSLPAHFSADHAPRDILQLLAAWLGLELDESQTPAQRREMVRRAPELARRRGTKRGLELALKLWFPGVPLRVEEPGGVRWGKAVGRDAAGPTFIVYCDEPIAEPQQAAIARCIEQHRPVHAAYRLRVKAPRAKAES